MNRDRAAPDVEGPHRQLGAGLADRLGGDDADRFAGVDQHATTQVTAVALGAQAVAHVAGQRGAHAHLVDAELLDSLDQILVEQFAGRDRGFLRLGVDDIDGGDAAEHAVTQRLDDLAALDQRPHRHAVAGAAIPFVAQSWQQRLADKPICNQQNRLVLNKQ